MNYKYKACDGFPFKAIMTGRAARILDVSVQWVRVLVERGVLQAHRTDKGILIFDEDHVRAYAAERIKGVE